jgi:thioesterase domain-containing protein
MRKPGSGATFAVASIPGDHETMLREPHVRALAGKLQRFIAAVDEPTHPDD